MNKPLVGALMTLFVTGATITGASAEPRAEAAPAPRAQAVDFAGSVALSNCSGSLVRLAESTPQDPALVLSNGHCLEEGMPGPGEVVVDKPSGRSFDLLDASGGKAGAVKASKIAYATMTDTDMAVYELTSTYEQIEQKHGIKALELSGERPAEGMDISVVSGYWKKIYSCKVDGFVHEMREADWTWKDSVRYTSPGCEIIGGTSGSPVVDQASGKVVAVNNTTNESGEECTLNNPCEVDENGEVTVREGTGYAQQTYGFAACVGTGNKVDLGREGCTLPKPAGVTP